PAPVADHVFPVQPPNSLCRVSFGAVAKAPPLTVTFPTDRFVSAEKFTAIPFTVNPNNRRIWAAGKTPPDCSDTIAFSRPEKSGATIVPVLPAEKVTVRGPPLCASALKFITLLLPSARNVIVPSEIEGRLLKIIRPPAVAQKF